jgi:alpha-mannosidase
MPLLAAFATGEAGPLAASAAGLSVSRRGVLVTTFGPLRDQSATVLRLWEHAGQGGPCEIHLPPDSRFSTAQRVDLRGDSIGEPIAIVEGKLSVEVRPFAPVAFRLMAK